MCRGDDAGGEGASSSWVTGRLRATAAYGVFGSSLTFGDGLNALLERRAVSAGVDLRLKETSTLSFRAGAGLSGRLSLDGDAYDVLPGWLVAASYSRRLLDGRGAGPFLLFSVSAAASGARTSSLRRREDTGLYAVDLRAGVSVGKTFWEVLSPYAAFRLFGGPVFWERDGKALLGTDRYHVQAALGMMSSLPGGFDLYAEVAPLGERAATVGVGYSF